MPDPGFDHRLAYLRWLRNRGRVKPETDGEVAAWLGVGIKWLGKWKGRADAPEGRTEARAVERALAELRVSMAWFYDGDGVAPEPARWQEWTRAIGQPPGALILDGTAGRAGGLEPRIVGPVSDAVKQASAVRRAAKKKSATRRGRAS